MCWLEDSVSYEVAKLAQRKGYAARTYYYYEDWNHGEGTYYAPYKTELRGGEVWAPTAHQLNKWLRETHQLHVQVSPKQGHLLEWYVYVINGKEVVAELKGLFFTEYEAALERGLELALNLLPD